MKENMFGLLLLAMVQIIVEVLPISSSGHMSLVSRLADALGYPLPEPPHYFDEFLHGFTLIAVLIFFRNVWVPVAVRLWQMLQALWQKRHLRDTEKRLLHLLLRVLGWVGVTMVITVAGYFAVKLSGVELALEGPLFLALGFALTGCMLAICSLFHSCGAPFDKLRRSEQRAILDPNKSVFSVNQAESCSPLILSRSKDASKRWKSGAVRTLAIAAAQVLACLMPGFSRFGATIFMAHLIGISPRRAVQWSWLIFMPLMLGASLVHGVGTFVLADHNYFVFKPLFFGGCVLATGVSYAIFAGVVRLFHTRRSWLLGVYMLIPLLLLLMVR